MNLDKYDLFVYSDESGVLDNKTYDKYLFGGMIFVGKQSKDNAARLYRAQEQYVYGMYPELSKSELKGYHLHGIYEKGFTKLIRTHVHSEYLNFVLFIDQTRVHQKIFEQKKSKQRYLDWVYRVGLKRAIWYYAGLGYIDLNRVKDIHFYVDEHPTATDGKYELREGLLEEFKYGMFSYASQYYFKPLIPTMRNVDISFADSKTMPLVRSADILSNYAFRLYRTSSYNSAVLRLQTQFKDRCFTVLFP